MTSVLILTIATEGGVYDTMKGVLARHLEHLPEGWAHKFVYGGDYGGALPHGDDVVVGDVRESLVPGVMHKTLAALKAHLREEDQYVIRTNLSTIWLWPRLAEYLASAPRSGFAAGTADAHCGPHMCGCAMIWSRDVAQRLVTDPAIVKELTESTAPDDVALSEVLQRISSCTPMPRLDSLCQSYPNCMMHTAGIPWEECTPRVTHARFKGRDRAMDAVIMHCFQHLVTERPGADLMTTLHVAQSLAVTMAEP